MGNNLTLILGGARSGKSTYAQKMAEESGRPVTFVATAQAFDDEMAARIIKHQSERPAGWQTLEAPLGIGKAVRGLARPGGLVLVDCLTLLASNVILTLANPEDGLVAQAALEAEIDDLLAAVAQSSVDWIIVSNEVGLGLVPEYPLGRVYRDALGRANQRIASAASRVIFMVAGLPMVVK